MNKDNSKNLGGSVKLTDAEQKQKVKNMEKEAKGKSYLGEGNDGVRPMQKGEKSETLNRAQAADQAGETKIVSASNPANEISPPRAGEPTIQTIDGQIIGVKHVWDMNFSNAENNIEGLGHAFAAVGVDFTSAAQQDDEDQQEHVYTLKPSDAKDSAKPSFEGKLAHNATVDDVYAVFLDYCLSKKPTYVGNFGAHATKQD